MNRKKALFSQIHQLSQYFLVIILGAIAIGVIFTLNEFKLSSRFFPIKTVKIYGLQNTDRHAAEDLILPLLEDGFFAINIDNIRDRLAQLPWVSSIFVKRNWPDQLEIIIEEKQALAYWNDHSLLSKNGELFFPDKKTYPLNLPQFLGSNGAQMKMIQYFIAIDRLLKPLHVTVTRLELTSDNAWKIILSNGIKLNLGADEGLGRFKRFVGVYPQIIGDKAIGVENIDLRYSNGIAVRWKQAT